MRKTPCCPRPPPPPPPRLEGIVIDAARLDPPADDPDRPLVIEGAGGLMVPLTEDMLLIDLFARWGLPLVLCARSGLGTLNHTLLSLEALRRRGIAVLGVALIGPPHGENARIIARLGAVKVLGTLPPLDPLAPAPLAATFAAGFRRVDFLAAGAGA